MSSRWRSGHGLHVSEARTIVDKVACPTCGAERGWPCTPLRETGHATVLRPHPDRAWLADGGTLPRPKRTRKSTAAPLERTPR